METRHPSSDDGCDIVLLLNNIPIGAMPIINCHAQFLLEVRFAASRNLRLFALSAN